jgi:hypothetical protein
MKFNKWTLGLAAVGVVSMASAVNADETKLSPLQTALSTTTISGSVDTAAQYNPGDAVQTPNNKVDNFSLNSATISLDKPLDEAPWASGYHIDLNAGTDAITPLNTATSSTTLTGRRVRGMSATTSTDINAVGLRQAYVALRTPVGNGIDWKMGLFDGVTGYESNTGYLNPNYTRSFGYMMNPSSELGLIGSYKIVDCVSVQMGMANSQNYYSSSDIQSVDSHDYIAALALTAPDSWGWLKGSVLNFGTVQSFEADGMNVYSVNATFATPVTGLKFGLAYDKLQALSARESQDGNVYGVYATYQATQKLGFNLRGEYVDGQNLDMFGYYNDHNVWTLGNGKGTEITATIEYDLWANVMTRLEARWDHMESVEAFNANNTADEYLLALNVVYKF